MFRKFFNWLKRKLKTRRPAPRISKPADAPVVLKWGIIIPHTESSPGAYTTHRLEKYGNEKISENFYGKKLAKALPHLPSQSRDLGGVFGAAHLLKASGCNASLEPHLNAYNTKAHGFELLVLEGDKASYNVAKSLVKAFKSRFPSRRIRNGGIKLVTPKDRGYKNLRDARKAGMKIAILSEAFFIDNPNDWMSVEEMAKFWKNNL